MGDFRSTTFAREKSRRSITNNAKRNTLVDRKLKLLAALLLVCTIAGFWSDTVSNAVRASLGCHKFCRELQRFPPGSPLRTRYFDMRTIVLTDGQPRRVPDGSTLLSSRESDNHRQSCGVDVSYRPSPWEREWRDSIDQYQTDDIFWTPGCEAMRWADNLTDHWLEHCRSRVSQSVYSSWSQDVFSVHEFSDSCTERVFARVPLEPLVGTLRHPHAVCDSKIPLCSNFLCRAQENLLGKKQQRGNSASLLNKDYLLPLSWKDFMLVRNRTCSSCDSEPRTFFFDLGASTYDDGGGGPSLSWFMNTYRCAGSLWARLSFLSFPRSQYSDIFPAYRIA